MCLLSMITSPRLILRFMLGRRAGAFCIGYSIIVYTFVKLGQPHYLFYYHVYMMSSFNVYLRVMLVVGSFLTIPHLHTELVLISLLIWRENRRLIWTVFPTHLTSMMKQNALRYIFKSKLQITHCSRVFTRMSFFLPHKER